MIINFNSPAATGRNSSQSESRRAQAETTDDRHGKIIPFQSSEEDSFVFRPVIRESDSIQSFRPKRLAAPRPKGRFKLTVFKPSGSRNNNGHTREKKVVDAGLGAMPVGYFPEAA